MQLPIGEEADFEGIIDLIKMKAFYFDGDNGEDVREEEIPADRVEEAKTARHDMIAAVADHDDGHRRQVPRRAGGRRRGAARRRSAA